MKIYTFVILFLVILLSVPAYAEILDFNRDFQVEHINGGVQIKRNLDLQRTQTTEIIRGHDLKVSTQRLINRAKDLWRGLKTLRGDQMRGADLTHIANQNAEDIIRRNKVIQQTQKQQQRDRMRALKAQNDALKQRIRDLSRR